MTTVNQWTDRNAYVYGAEFCITTHPKLGDITTPAKTAARSEDRAAIPSSSVRASGLVFAGDVHQACPFASASCVHPRTSLDVGRSSSSTSMTKTSDERTTSITDQGEEPAAECITNLGGTTPPLFQTNPPCSTKPTHDEGAFGVEQVEQGNNVSDNTERVISVNRKCSRDEGYVLTPFQLFQAFPLAVLSRFAGTTHPVPEQGGPCSTPGTTRECGKNTPTLFHTLFQPEVGA